MTLKVYTASWFTPLPPTIQKIGISRGSPRRYPAGYRLLGPLAPGAWFKTAPPMEYVERYYGEILARLDLQTTLRRLEELQDDKEGVALLCYEKPPFQIGTGNWCHRRIAASALEAELGQEIPEFMLPDISIGDTVPIAAKRADWAELAAKYRSVPRVPGHH